MRTNLKVLRVKENLSQGEAAEKLGFTRATYSSIEGGTRAGSQKFWCKVQETFNVPDADMWPLMKNE